MCVETALRRANFVGFLSLCQGLDLFLGSLNHFGESFSFEFEGTNFCFLGEHFILVNGRSRHRVVDLFGLGIQA